MLRRMSLTNFKCWRELDVELAPISIFFGTNSSGKTAILQSLLMLKQTVASRDPNQHLNFGGGTRDFVDLGSYHDLVYGHDTDKSVGVNLYWDLSYEAVKELAVARWAEDRTDYHSLYPAVTLRYEVVWGFGNGIFIKKLGYKFIEDNSDASKVELTREAENQYCLTHSAVKGAAGPSDYGVLASHPVGAPKYCHQISVDEISSRDASGLFVQVAGNHVTTTSAHIARLLEAFFNQLGYLGPLREYPKRYYQWTGEKKTQIVEPNGADAIAALISSVRDNQSLHNEVANQLTKLELVDSFAVRTTDQQRGLYEVSISVKEKEAAILDVGFGVSQVLPVITLLFSAPSGSTVLLEQPELHLHPNAQAALADLMLYAAETRNLQLIVESHSEHILRRLQRRIAETESEFATPENIKMYFCEPGEGGSTISEVDVDRFGQISNWPEKFLGDISGDLHNMVKAALARRRTELENA